MYASAGNAALNFANKMLFLCNNTLCSMKLKLQNFSQELNVHFYWYFAFRKSSKCYIVQQRWRTHYL